MEDLERAEKRLELVVGEFGVEPGRDESFNDFIKGKQASSTAALQITLSLTQFCEAYTTAAFVLHIVAKFIFAVQKVPHSLPHVVQILARHARDHGLRCRVGASSTG